jgi:hypothetical protein
VEVCGDPECGALVARATDVEGQRWAADPLPVGRLYWRVTAVALSGLDGYPSAAGSFHIDDPIPDRIPPVVVAVREGPGRNDADGATLGAGGALRLESHDDASGAVRIRYRWNDGEWRDYSGEPLTPPAAQATLHAQTQDHRGRWSEAWSLPVRVGG